MLNGNAVNCALVRPKIADKRYSYELPASVGVFFQSCWNGKETRHHELLGDGTCPNCGHGELPVRYQSLHAIRSKHPGRPTVIALDHRLTCGLAAALTDDSYLVRPLFIAFRADGVQTITITSDQNIRAEDIETAAMRIMQVWNRYFRGDLGIDVTGLHSGQEWRK